MAAVAPFVPKIAISSLVSNFTLPRVKPRWRTIRAAPDTERRHMVVEEDIDALLKVYV